MVIGINLLYLIPGRVGGTETYARELIGEMSKTTKLVLFCGRDTALTFESSQNIKIVTLPIYSSNRFVRLIAEQTILPWLCYRVGVTALFSLGYSAPFVHSFKSIVTIHDLNWYYHPEDFSKFDRFAWKWLTIFSVKTSDQIIAISQATADSIHKVLGVDTKKINTILHGAGQIKLIKQDEAKKRIQLLGVTSPYLFTVLAGYPHKNLITLLKAFKIVVKNFPKLSLVVCGLSGRADINNQNYINENNLNKNVIFLGYVNELDLAALYTRAEIFVFPSAYEGFGIPVIEAMQYGVPVISSNAYSLSEVVGNGGVLVSPYDISEYVDSISDIFVSSKNRVDLIKRGKIRSRKLKWSETVYKMLNLI